MNSEDRFSHYVKHGWCPVPWAHHPEPVKELIRAIGFRPQLKGCFYNSQLLFIENERRSFGLDLEYREGWVHAIIPFEHAWLTYKGELLDLTLAPDREVPPTYLKSIGYSYEDVTNNMFETGCYTSVTSAKDFYDIGPWKEGFEALDALQDEDQDRGPSEGT